MKAFAGRGYRVLRYPIQSFRTATPTQRAVAYTTSAVAVPYSLVTGYHDYQAWLAAGPGGLPYNVLGWMAQLGLGSVSPSDVTSLAVYDNASNAKKYGEQGQQTYLENTLPERKGSRPHVPNFFAPQRQAPDSGQSSPKEIQLRETTLLKTLAANNPTLFQLGSSRFERYGIAVYLLPTYPTPPGTEILGREFVHFHSEIQGVKGWHGAADGSGHCALSVSDAKEVVEKGWGQRHRLSGKFGFVLGYTMIYAPRDEEELEVVDRIVKASARYMTSGAEVK